MNTPQLKLKLKKIRAIENAEIIIDGITVITGENGSGKSTISKLAYHTLKTATKFDDIIDDSYNAALDSVLKAVNQIAKELSSLVPNNEFIKLRLLRRIKSNQSSLFEEEQNYLALAIDRLINLYHKIPSNLSNYGPNKLLRIRKILQDLMPEESSNKIDKLLAKLKESIESGEVETNKLKEQRPINFLLDILEDEFFDNPIPKTYNFEEFGVPIFNFRRKKIEPILTLKNIAYIDTPMIFGLENIYERSHWDDLNDLIRKKRSSAKNKTIDDLFKNNIFKGDIRPNDEKSKDNPFIYKRNNGEEFNLIECATGLKSFAILQILFKNGYLDKNTLLIIDEPEAHLHPQWVVEYARLVVLLNKILGVKFLIASHHPDMISAIRYISEKEEITTNLHFYLAEREGSSYMYNYRHLGLDIEDIFASFNIAFKRIDLYGKTD